MAMICPDLDLKITSKLYCQVLFFRNTCHLCKRVFLVTKTSSLTFHGFANKFHVNRDILLDHLPPGILHQMQWLYGS